VSLPTDSMNGWQVKSPRPIHRLPVGGRF